MFIIPLKLDAHKNPVCTSKKTPHNRYKDELVNAVKGNDHCLYCENRMSPGAECRVTDGVKCTGLVAPYCLPGR